MRDSVAKHDRLRPVEQNAILEMILHRARQDAPLDVATFAREHVEFGISAGDHAFDLGLLAQLPLAGHRQLVEWNRAVERRIVTVARVIRHDPDDSHRQLAHTSAIQQIGEQVIELGDENEHALARGRIRHCISNRSAILPNDSRNTRSVE